MRIHFREQYGTKGGEVIYVTPAGKYFTHIIVFTIINENIYF